MEASTAQRSDDELRDLRPAEPPLLRGVSTTQGEAYEGHEQEAGARQKLVFCNGWVRVRMPSSEQDMRVCL